ncbi:unnamed protein product [Microthlaspi erraticum]|uniref:Erythronate-4-phosphate dehydrogenase family protein n=1 Tax=Microthlaspi erraticum TaxID=1685480 RepID=A0A6D2JZV4_9BRAS|nr:unnamed protein product [Microthlaspi erraticum]
MAESYETRNNGVRYHNSRISSSSSSTSSTTSLSSPLLDLRVFYVRISNFKVDDSTPEVLTITHTPLDPDSLLEINGVRMSIYSEGVATSQLRKDRVDKKSEVATFISTDNIRLSGSVKFEVYDRDDLVLSGTIEMSGSNGFTSGGESKHSVKRWSMNCEAEITAGSGFLKEKHIGCSELSSSSSSPLPSIEVYVTGCFSGTPIILTKTLQLGFRKKQSRGNALDSIPEYETGEPLKGDSSELDFQVTEYGRYKQDYDGEYGDMYMRREYADGEDGEMSWFNAGVRVGVGIGLGVCVGLGIGVGLLVRTYQSTTRNFRRRLI